MHLPEAQRLSESPVRSWAGRLRKRLWSQWSHLRQRAPTIGRAAGSPLANARVTGNISREDVGFYTWFLEWFRPDLVIEIGVASGFSSVIALRAMAEWGGRLASYDISESCYYDRSLPVGFFVAQEYPEGLSRWELHTGRTAVDAAATHSGVTVAFIDGEHAHPHPTQDLVNLTPAMARDSRFVLHDINLPRVIEDGSDSAARLYDGWKGLKIRLGQGRDNIGAVQWAGRR